VIQGRVIGATDVAAIRELVAGHPSLSRYQLSRALCRLWEWRDPKGQIKDMAARTLLLKMEARGWITLPAKRCESPNRMQHKKVATVEYATDPISDSLAALQPLDIRELSPWPEGLALFECLLRQAHYLSYTSSVGLNLKYLVRDRRGRPWSCLLLGSAAWKCAVRDRFIGWSAAEREAHLQQITNQTRFLILPWVRVSGLASQVLSAVMDRVRQDWWSKYARPLERVETFVDTSRFVGGCYRAANWICLGSTTGRTRQDRWKRIQVAPKEVWVCPLSAHFRQRLRS
jgi:hypothetical protein